MIAASWKYVLENFSHLQPVDYVLVGVLLFLLGTGMFSVLRWIFGAVIKAQKELVDVKEQTIAEYKRSVKIAERSRESTERDAERLARQLQEVSTAYHAARDAASSLERTAQRAQGNLFALALLLIQSESLHLTSATIGTVRAPRGPGTPVNSMTFATAVGNRNAADARCIRPSTCGVRFDASGVAPLLLTSNGSHGAMRARVRV